MADESSRSAGGTGNQHPRELSRGVRRPGRLVALAAFAAVAIAATVITPLIVTGHGGPAASAGHHSATAPPRPTGSAALAAPGGCARRSRPANSAYRGSPASSITVCPGRAAVGAVVHITMQGCDTPSRAAAGLVFLGPSSFIGSSGGGDAVAFKPADGDRATAAFTIPASYAGGGTGASPSPALPVRPGEHYAFATYPAGICHVPFTVTSAGAGGIRILVISRAVRRELAAAYVAYRRISPSDVAGTRPGSVHYAYDSASGTYWALAIFAPSKTASPKVQVGFQDGRSVGFFTKAGSGTWQVQTGAVPVVCAALRFFPRAVLRAWSLPINTAIVGGC